MTTRQELQAELDQLEAANEAATGWGAAVGARWERIKGIRSQLERMDAVAALRTRSSAAIDELRMRVAKALYVRNHGPNPDWPIGVDKLGYQQEPYVKHVPAWEWFHGGDADTVLSVIHDLAQLSPAPSPESVPDAELADLRAAKEDYFQVNMGLTNELAEARDQVERLRHTLAIEQDALGLAQGLPANQSPMSTQDIRDLANLVIKARDEYLNAMTYATGEREYFEKRLKAVFWDDKGSFGPALLELADRRELASQTAADTEPLTAHQPPEGDR